MKKHIVLAALGLAAAAPALAQTGVGAPSAVTITPFTFQTIASRNPDFDPSGYTYPSGSGRVRPTPMSATCVSMA